MSSGGWGIETPGCIFTETFVTNHWMHGFRHWLRMSFQRSNPQAFHEVGSRLFLDKIAWVPARRCQDYRRGEVHTTEPIKISRNNALLTLQ